MKDRKKILIVCCVCLFLACLAILTARAFWPREELDDPMEEEELLLYLAEQGPQIAEPEQQDLFWVGLSDPAE